MRGEMTRAELERFCPSKPAEDFHAQMKGQAELDYLDCPYHQVKFWSASYELARDFSLGYAELDIRGA